MAHPFYRRRTYPDEVIQKVDGLEAYNAQNVVHKEKVLSLAKRFHKPIFAGSDAHFLRDIGRGFNEVDISLKEAGDFTLLKQALLIFLEFLS